jgi:hypothetical protein
MALKRQEVIIEFNAETNEAVSSVEELEGSYGQLEQKIEDVARAQEAEGRIAKDRDKQRSKEADNIKKTVDKIAEAEKKRAAIEKGGTAERDEGSSQYIGDLNEINNGLSKVTEGQTGFLSTAISGFDTLKQGISGATAGFSLMKTAIAATGIGLLVTAAVELYDVVGDIYEAFRDKSAERALERQLDLRTQQAEKAEEELEIAQAMEVNRYKEIELRQKALSQAAAQQNAELRLAKELRDEERILAAQNRLKELQRDLTINQINAEQVLADRLEESRRAADDDYLAEQAELRRIANEYHEGSLELTDEEFELYAKQRILEEQQAKEDANNSTKAQKEFSEFLTRFGKTVEARNKIKGLIEEQATLEEIILNFKEAQNAADREEAQLAEERGRLEAGAQRERELQNQLFDELFKLTLEAQDREILSAQEVYDRRIAIAGDDEGLIKMATEQLQKDIKAIDDKYAALREPEEGADGDIDPRLAMLEKYYAAAQVLLQQDLEVTRDMELASIQERYATQLALAEELGMDKEILLEAQRKEELAINEKYDQLEAEREEQKFQMRMSIAVQGVQAIEALGKAFASQDEADAERSFKVQKGLSIASATVSAVEGVINAYKTAQSSPFTLINPAYPYIQAGLAAAFGTAQVATIARQQYTPSGTPENIDPGPGAGGGQGLTAPTIDLSFLGEGAGQAEPIRAYVLAENVSNAQQANQKILDQTTL